MPSIKTSKMSVMENAGTENVEDLEWCYSTRIETR